MQGLSVIDETVECANVAKVETRELWHQRLAHIGGRALDKMSSGEFAKGVNFNKSETHDVCEGCAKGKSTRSTPKPINEIKTTRKLELVHTDVCGPMHIPSRSGMTYMVSFTDDHTRVATVYFMIHKSDVVDKFSEYHAKVVGESGEQIGRLRSDGGGEYDGRMKDIFASTRSITRLQIPIHPNKMVSPKG